MSRKSTRRTARQSKRTHSQQSQSSLGRSLSGRSFYGRKLRLEPLEDRRLLAVVTVTTLSDTVDFNDGVTSLREAIFAANLVPGADTIQFDPSLTAGGPAKILLTQGELAITDPLTIDGPGADKLTIDAQQQSRIFDITATTGDYTIDGLTLTGGRTNGSADPAINTFAGGAIRSRSAGTLTVKRSILSGNRTYGQFAYGGAIFSVGSLAVNDSTLAENGTAASGAHGGAIFCAHDATLTNSTVAHNSTAGTGAYGGGIGARGNVTLVNTSVNENEVIGSFSSAGGVSAGGVAVLNGSTVSGNTATFWGGGILSYGGVQLTASAVIENTITSHYHGDGGGIWSHGNVTLNESVVSGNYGSDRGGGIYCQSDVTITESSISGNTGRLRAGGIEARGAVMLNQSTVSGNSSIVNELYDGAVFSSGYLTVNQSTVSGNSAGGIFAASGVLVSESTVADNNSSMRFGCGGISLYIHATATIRGSIIAGNQRGDLIQRGCPLTFDTV